MDPAAVHLTRGGVSVVLAPSPSGEPTVLHWGAALGPLDDEALAALVERTPPGVPHSALDQPRLRGLVGETTSGFTGLPALEGSGPVPPAAGPGRRGCGPGSRASPRRPTTPSATLRSVDAEAGWDVTVDLELTREGLLRLRTWVTNAGAATSCWARSAPRCRSPPGPPSCSTSPAGGAASAPRSAVRGSRAPTCARAATAAPATTPPCCWSPATPASASATARCGPPTWPGAATTRPTPSGRRRGSACSAAASCSAPARSCSPRASATTRPGWSPRGPTHGLDGVADRLHAWLRRHSPRTRRTRPVLVNTWEAVYFDHDLASLTALADAAAEVGVERFVLDDGWMLGRRDDLPGLGDWTVDPDGLAAGPAPAGRPRAGPRPRLRPLGRARDGQRRLRPGARAPRLGAARPRPTCRRSGGTSRCSTSRCPRPTPTCATRCWRCSTSTTSPTSSGTTTATWSTWRTPDAPPCTGRRWRSTGCSTSCAPRTPTSRSRPAPAAEAGSTSRCSRAPTGSGPATPSTRSSGSASSAGPRCWCRRRCWAPTSGRRSPTPPAARCRPASGPPPRCSATSASSGTSQADADERREVAAWVALHKRVRPLLATGSTGPRRPPRPGAGGHRRGRRRRRRGLVRRRDRRHLATQSPAPVLLPGLDPDRRYLVTDETPPAYARSRPGRTWLDGEGVELPGARSRPSACGCR